MAGLGLKKYSIVIPTRNRQRYCVESAASALLSGRDDVQVIVADNSDDPDLLPAMLKEQGLYDRVTFLPSSAQMLPMRANWERALDVVQGEWVCYIGDDDALHAESYDMMDFMADNMSPKVHTWRPVYYKWPCFPEQDRSLLHLSYEAVGCTIQKSQDVLLQHIEFKHNDKWPAAGPSIYHGLVHFTVIAITRKLYGEYFLNYVVDYACAITNATFIKSYVQYYWPITIMGACGNSNTAGLTSTGSGKKKIDHFFAENPDRRADYEEYETSRLHAPWVIAGYSQILDRIGLPFEMTPEKFARSVRSELARVRDAETFDEERIRLLAFARKHNLGDDFIGVVEEMTRKAGQKFIGLVGSEQKNLYIDTAGFGWTGILDVATNIHSLLPRFSDYRPQHEQMLEQMRAGAPHVMIGCEDQKAPAPTPRETLIEIAAEPAEPAPSPAGSAEPAEQEVAAPADDAPTSPRALALAAAAAAARAAEPVA